MQSSLKLCMKFITLFYSEQNFWSLATRMCYIGSYFKILLHVLMCSKFTHKFIVEGFLHQTSKSNLIWLAKEYPCRTYRLHKFALQIYAMASIFLAAKIEECPRRIRDVINVFHHIKQRRNAR